MSFALKPGPFKRLVGKAQENPHTAYVLIIDEINRANLAKVFGELYFLLEYRDQNVDLLYSRPEDPPFTLPANVYLIGTMNTSDRSIALVDAAMRRRFAFVSLHPDQPPTSGVLRRWLQRQGHADTLADIHDALNARIEDSDFKIGPSYFMRPEVHLEGGLDRLWQSAVLPLLEEHHFGDGTDVARRYGLDRSGRRCPRPLRLRRKGRRRATSETRSYRGWAGDGCRLVRVTGARPCCDGLGGRRGFGGGLWSISALTKVGAAVVGDVELAIAPKVPIGRLIFLLGYAASDKGWLAAAGTSELTTASCPPWPTRSSDNWNEPWDPASCRAIGQSMKPCPWCAARSELPTSCPADMASRCLLKSPTTSSTWTSPRTRSSGSPFTRFGRCRVCDGRPDPHSGTR